MDESLRIAAADSDARVRRFYGETFARAGHGLTLVDGWHGLLAHCRVAGPDLVVAEVAARDQGAAGAVAELEARLPVVLVAAECGPEFLALARQYPACVGVAKPVHRSQLVLAVELARSRFASFRSHRDEVARLRQALEDRKLVERAKGIVMRRLRVTEQDAYDVLRKLSSERSQRLPEIARLVFEADAPYDALEHPDADRLTARLTLSASVRASDCPGAGSGVHGTRPAPRTDV